MTEKTISWKQSNIFYRVTGEGKTVLLIHGFAEDGDVWSSQVEYLKRSFRLIIPDIPGSGSSDLVADAGIETYAEIIKAILEAEIKNSVAGEDGRIAMIGHSMGGYISLAFAEKYPGDLETLCLFHSTAFPDNEEKKQARLKAIDFIRDNGALAFLETSIPGLFTKAYAAQHPGRISELVEKGKKISIDALIQYYQAMIARPDRTAVLTSFPRAILFIIGEHDSAIPLENSLRQTHLPSESHVHILDKSAHMGMWEEEEKANKILYDFLITKF